MFEGLRVIGLVVEVLAWLGLGLGVVVAVMSLNSPTSDLGLFGAGALIGGGLMLILMARMGRAVAFIADTANEERNAMPTGGGKAPGRLVKALYGRDIRAISHGRFFAEGQIYSSVAAAEKAISQAAEKDRAKGA